MKKINKIFKFLLIAIATTLITSACNSNSSDDPYAISSDVTVLGFSLKKDISILSGIDSVFFSIDLQKGLIFNADSLPKGTDITRLIPIISYPSTVMSATITMSDGSYKTGSIDYKNNPSDSIDFSGKVILTLIAQDGFSTKDYQIKVNVHNMEPDSLTWDKIAVSQLPSRMAEPRNQRTIMFGDEIISLIQEADATFTISKTYDPNKNNWTKEEIEFPFTPNIRSLSATENALYIIDSEGVLYTSNDAINWESTNKRWKTIIGGYADILLGLRVEGESILHTHYPLLSEASETPIDKDFPINGFSNFNTFTNKWSIAPIGILCGGETQNGSLTAQTWGYDGNTWAKLSNHTPPAVKGGTLIPYFVHKQTSMQWITNEYSIWFFTGGIKADGTFNKELYISYDNGVNWFIGSSLLQMPDYIPGMQNMDNIIFATELSSNIEPKGWSNMPIKQLPSWYKIKYATDGYNITWDCPYIYLIGGQDANNKLYNTIWKGVINRLSFVPLI